MDRYRVKAPYVLAKAMTADGLQVKGIYEGALVPDGVSEEWVERHLRKGMIEKVPGGEVPARVEEVPSPPPAAPPGPDAPQPPPESGPGASKQAWEEYAVASGMDPKKAKAMSRDDLIAAHRKD